MTKTWAALLLLWFTCGFLAWGITLRHDLHRWPSSDCRQDQSFAVVWGEVFGPVALMISASESGFAEHDMQWTCPAKEGKP